jgi:thioredoxin domain-containing protein 5
VTIVLAADAETVPELTYEEFNKNIFDRSAKRMKGDVPYFIKFYAPWCGHCKALASTWLELFNETKDKGAVNVVKVDCTNNDAKPICQQFGVRGYPTLKFLKGNKV